MVGEGPGPAQAAGRPRAEGTGFHPGRPCAGLSSRLWEAACFLRGWGGKTRGTEKHSNVRNKGVSRPSCAHMQCSPPHTALRLSLPHQRAPPPHSWVGGVSWGSLSWPLRPLGMGRHLEKVLAVILRQLCSWRPGTPRAGCPIRSPRLMLGRPRPRAGTFPHPGTRPGANTMSTWFMGRCT